MTGDEAAEVLRIIRRIGPVVLSAAVDPSNTAGASLRRAVGMMMVDNNMVNQATFVFAFATCLDLARHCKATLVTMDRVRKAVLTETPLSLPATLTINTIVRLTLATEARIIAYMTFRSRQELETIAEAVNRTFSETHDIAADENDAGTYMALIKLHGDVVKHLADRGRQLPRVITYHYQTVMPALRLAQMAYGNPQRYSELRESDNVVT